MVPKSANGVNSEPTPILVDFNHRSQANRQNEIVYPWQFFVCQPGTRFVNPRSLKWLAISWMTMTNPMIGATKLGRVLLGINETSHL